MKAFIKRHLGELGRYFGLAAVLFLFAQLDEADTFLTHGNLLNVATQTVIVAIAALGATMVIVSGGIDLSVGSIIALSTVTTALSLQQGAPPLAAGLIGIGTGGACGLVSGVIITSFRIVPFIATLGMLSIARGVAKLAAGGQTVRPDATWLDELMSKYLVDDIKWLLLPVGVWIMIVVSIVVSIMLRRTVFGRHIYAVGSNEATARLAGLPVARIKIMIYTLAGLLSGLAGLMQFSRLTLGDPTAAIGLELDVIAAVVIGGGSLSGGEGSVAGTLVGAFTLQFLRNGCNQIGVDNYVQDMIIGAIIIGAVAVDQWRKRISVAGA